MLLHVKIIEAVDVPKMDIFTDSDPYVILSLNNSSGREKTKVIDNTKHPIWNQDFHFPIRPQNQTLQLILMDKDVISKDDPISQYELPIGSLNVGQVYEEWIDMCPFKGVKTGGKLHLMYQALPNGKKPFLQNQPLMQPTGSNLPVLGVRTSNNFSNNNNINNNMYQQIPNNPYNQQPVMSSQYIQQQQIPRNPYTSQQPQYNNNSQNIYQNNAYMQQHVYQSNPYAQQPQLTFPNNNPYTQNPVHINYQPTPTFQNNPYAQPQMGYNQQFYSNGPYMQQSQRSMLPNHNPMAGAIPPRVCPPTFPNQSPSQLPQISPLPRTF